MHSEYDIVTAELETYRSDLSVWLPRFAFLLICCVIIGVYVFYRSRKKHAPLRLAASYMVTVTFVTLFVVIGMFINHRRVTSEIELYRHWIENDDYTQTQGTVSDVVCTETGRIASFAFDGRVFSMSDNPCLQDRSDLLSDGRTFVILQKDGVVLQINVPEGRGQQ